MAVRRLARRTAARRASPSRPRMLAWAKAQIAKYPEGRQASAVIPLLWRAQEQAGGWLPQKAIEHVAEMLGMANIRVLEVATFYTMFNLEPVGQIPRPALRHDAVHAARLRRADDRSAIAGSASSSTSPPTASSHGSRSSASAPA